MIEYPILIIGLSCFTSQGVPTCEIELDPLIASDHRVQSLGTIAEKLKLPGPVVKHTITKAEYIDEGSKKISTVSPATGQNFMRCGDVIAYRPFHLFCMDQKTWWLRTQKNFAFPLQDRYHFFTIWHQKHE